MKKIITALLCALTLLALAACGNASAHPGDEENAQTVNPFIDCETMQDAASVSGFDMTVPDRVDGYSSRTIQAVKDEMIQVSFLNEGKEIYIRKAVGSEDVSGDYNQYEEVNTATVGECEVAVKGNGGLISVATWTKRGYTYAIGMGGNGISLEDVTALVEVVC